MKILDLGCATGGFLTYLFEKGFTHLYGIDIVKNYIKTIKNKKFIIKKGSAEKIPFEDNTFDVIILDQVLEHIVDLQKAMEEIKRVLKQNGLLFISVPNAKKYRKKIFFQFYWLLIREHLHHFDLLHLKYLCSLFNFKFLSYKHCYTPIMTKKMLLPNLMTTFKLDEDNKKIVKINYFFKLLKIYIDNYISISKLTQVLTRKKINYILKKYETIYIFGIGKEFFYLYYNTELFYNNKVKRFIDNNKYKQENFTFNKQAICDIDILKYGDKNSCVIVTSVMHYKEIKKQLLNLNYKGAIIKV